MILSFFLGITTGLLIWMGVVVLRKLIRIEVRTNLTGRFLVVQTGRFLFLLRLESRGVQQ